MIKLKKINFTKNGEEVLDKNDMAKLFGGKNEGTLVLPTINPDDFFTVKPFVPDKLSVTPPIILTTIKRG